LILTGLGLDPRPPVLQTATPRYAAMDRHFAFRGPEGHTMMCSTASVQVCLDAGADDADVAQRWHALHAWLPVLTGLFANSPSPGWRCARTKVWAAIDPSRTSAPAGDDPRVAYARWALDAQVLAVRRTGGSWSAPPGLTFRGWLRGDRAGLPAPTWDDLDYHLTTLFPPVRAQGHLELRAIDAQPDDGWRVVTALVAALMDDPAARATATATALETGRSVGVAARQAMTDPALRRAGLTFVDTAVAVLSRAGQLELAAEVEGFGERYPARGRCPADDHPTAPEGSA
jgi:glutamate--cysteine ligase